MRKLSLISTAKARKIIKHVVELAALACKRNRLAETHSAIAPNLIALYKAFGGGWEIRKGKPIVPVDVQADMAAEPIGATCCRSLAAADADFAFADASGRGAGAAST